MRIPSTHILVSHTILQLQKKKQKTKITQLNKPEKSPWRTPASCLDAGNIQDEPRGLEPLIVPKCKKKKIQKTQKQNT